MPTSEHGCQRSSVRLSVVGRSRQLSVRESRLANRRCVPIVVECQLPSLADTVEERRILWRTYNNLKSWFEHWGEDLFELGFAEKDASGNTFVPEKQLHRIGNFDETCLSLDGSNGSRGGRPEVTFFSPSLPIFGRGTSKTALTTTMIMGSSAAGEAYPPHFQFSTKAKSAETQSLPIENVRFMPSVKGTFGAGEERE